MRNSISGTRIDRKGQFRDGAEHYVPIYHVDGEVELYVHHGSGLTLLHVLHLVQRGKAPADHIATTRQQRTFLATDTVQASEGLVQTLLGLGEGQTLNTKRLLGILFLGVQAFGLGHDTTN